MTVCILVPVLGRPHNVAPLVMSIEGNTPEPHRTLFIASRDDADEIDALNDAGCDWMHVDEPGTYARKIDAGFRASWEPHLFSAADDVAFGEGWLSAAVEQLGDGIEVVGTCDGHNARTLTGDHSTHTLFSRRYIEHAGGVVDRPAGQVLCELYPHEGCDDEFVATAKSRGVYAHADDSVVEHRHVSYGLAPDDATYALARSHAAEGLRLLHEREHLWASDA